MNLILEWERQNLRQIAAHVLQKTILLEGYDEEYKNKQVKSIDILNNLTDDDINRFSNTDDLIKFIYQQYNEYVENLKRLSYLEKLKKEMEII